MQLQRRGAAGAEIPVVIEQEQAFDLRPVTSDIDPSFFASEGIARVRGALAAGSLPLIDVSGSRFGPPLTRSSAVICVGQNYAAHAAETGSPPPDQPIIFFKHPNTLVGAYDAVLRPPGAQSLDWEVELAVVIGRRARYLPDRAAALRCVAGYTISDDISERDYQVAHSGGQWSKGKSCETFNPLGPSIIPRDEVRDEQALRLQSWVNDEPRQDSTTADMIVDVGSLLQHLSHYLVLEPGDLINTGTPQGVAMSGRFPYLADDDEVRIAIQGLGEQLHRVRPAPRISEDRITTSSQGAG